MKKLNQQLAAAAFTLLIAACSKNSDEAPMSESMTEAVSENIKDVGTKLDEIKDETMGSAGEMAEAAKEKTGEMIDATKAKAGDMVDATKAKTGEVMEATKAKTAEVVDASKDKMGGIAEGTESTLDKAGSKASEINEDVKGTLGFSEE